MQLHSRWLLLSYGRRTLRWSQEFSSRLEVLLSLRATRLFHSNSCSKWQERHLITTNNKLQMEHLPRVSNSNSITSSSSSKTCTISNRCNNSSSPSSMFKPSLISQLFSKYNQRHLQTNKMHSMSICKYILPQLIQNSLLISDWISSN